MDWSSGLAVLTNQSNEQSYNSLSYSPSYDFSHSLMYFNCPCCSFTAYDCEFYNKGMCYNFLIQIFHFLHIFIRFVPFKMFRSGKIECILYVRSIDYLETVSQKVRKKHNRIYLVIVSKNP